MNRIEDIFTGLRASGRAALMPFLTAGYPSLEATRDTLLGLEDAGAHIVELGIPFSDPIADGPVIAASMHEALQQGVTPDDIFDLVASVRGQTELGLVAMVSNSIVRRIGPEAFVNRAADVGFDGLIVPDIDIDEADALRALTDTRDLTFTVLIAPGSTDARVERLAGLCRGFIYLLARLGVTGERADVPEITDRVSAIRAITDLPIAAGFGISTADQVAQVTRDADAAIVGSALVRRMTEASDPVAAATRFVRTLAAGLATTEAAP